MRIPIQNKNKIKIKKEKVTEKVKNISILNFMQ